MKNALIFGLNGQDGTYLSKLLLNEGYNISGIVRGIPKRKINGVLTDLLSKHNIQVIEANILNLKKIEDIILNVNPTEIYYLATTHEMEINIENYETVMNINVYAYLNVLDTIRKYKLSTRVFYASSSNIYANSIESPQNEKTKPHANSLYGVAKLSAMQLSNIYKEKYGIFSCSGILFNHESSLRQKFFLPKKIVDTAVNIKLGQQTKLVIGSLYDKRDWGYAPDYVEAMWLMLQSHKARDYVIGTGKLSYVKDLIEYVFGYLDLEWRNYLAIDTNLFREQNLTQLQADPKKIFQDLGWRASTSTEVFLRNMIEDNLNSKS